MTRSMGAIVHRLRRHPPRVFADYVRMVDGCLVIRVLDTISFERPCVVREQPQALPQKAMDLLTVARFVQVDVLYDLILIPDTSMAIPGCHVG